MKKIIRVTLACFLASMTLCVSANDSTQVDEPNHFGPIPLYTPFLTMFKLDRTTANWEVAFAIIVEKEAEIYFDENIPNKVCGNIPCEKAFMVNVYPKNHSDSKAGKSVNEWLKDRKYNTTLERREVNYGTGTTAGHEICTFIIELRQNDLGRHPYPTIAPFKVIIGEHPDLKFKGKMSVHEGGTVHWPGGD